MRSIQAGARVTVGFEWPYFDEEDDPTTQELAAHGLFGTVLSAKRGMVTVQWDIPGSSACTYKWGADGKYDLCVIAEGPEDLDWRPLLTGGIPFLQKLANRVRAALGASPPPVAASRPSGWPDAVRGARDYAVEHVRLQRQQHVEPAGAEVPPRGWVGPMSRSHARGRACLCLCA